MHDKFRITHVETNELVANAVPTLEAAIELQKILELAHEGTFVIEGYTVYPYRPRCTETDSDGV
jgi:hypothetical protein